MTRNLFFIAATSVFFLLSCKNLIVSTEHFVVENELIAKTFRYTSNGPGSLKVKYVLKKGQQNIKLTSDEDVPFFEFAVNGQVVSSIDEFWRFSESSNRVMLNGGIEHRLTFEGVEPVVKGLEIVLYQQVFPKSTLIREKMEINTKEGSFALTKVDGQLHFKFPSYSILNGNNETADVTEIKIASWEKTPITFGDEKKGNHMFYPSISKTKSTQETNHLKGPITIIENGDFSWLSAYEHASQDDLRGMFDTQKLGTGNKINDAMQGTKGVFNFPLHDTDFKFLGMANQTDGNTIKVSLDMLRGGYFDGEVIDKEHPYTTVWTVTGVYEEQDLEVGKKMVHHYLLSQICEKPASRIPEFYYNTWGLQREDKNRPLTGILTYDRVFEEIEYAAQMGMDIFVLDYGWGNKQGEWFANEERFPKGLDPIKKRLDNHGMKMGLWFSPMGIDSTSPRYKEHPEWVIKDSENNPIMAQWDKPAFDFVSDFFNLFITDCKLLIDQGCTFMKWDAINTFYSSLPNLHHGDERYSEDELRARYEYLLPIYVVKAMEILTDYEPDLVIELDITEARRVMVGLAPFSQGKIFWMNNGASTYNDYSTFRTKSMRTIANEYAGIIPLELITYANYPHNSTNNMVYNVNNSLLAGHGFWGNLDLMNDEQRLWVGKQVAVSKKILPYQVNIIPEVTGKVGDSPEIYKIINPEKAAGHVFIFSDDAVETNVDCQLDSNNLFAVLNQPYVSNKEGIGLRFALKTKDASEVAFIVPNENNGVSIKDSSNKITQAVFTNGVLEYSVLNEGVQHIRWDKKNGKPKLQTNSDVTMEIENKEDYYMLTITPKTKTKIILKSDIQHSK